MTRTKPIFCVNLGAFSVKAAEFAVDPTTDRLTLRAYSTKRVAESKREQETIAALREAKTELAFSGHRASFCASGQNTFAKFVKLPAVDNQKLRQIIQYEAQQQIPYPIDQAVWDFQIVKQSDAAETEILLAALKTDAVEAAFRAAESCSLRLELMDAPIAALANAFLFNYADLPECSLLIDIGAKTTHVLLIENGRFFGRSINLGSANITHEFVAETKTPFAKAEQLKIEHGFVGLGGAYEDPEDPHHAAISKIARQVMTRLHAQIAQTIQFYRSQHGGCAPQQVFLAGAGSLLPYTTQFFAEKLNAPVAYFNPLRNVEIDPAIPEADLAKFAPALGELVGLALRDIAKCPVELNLVPKSIRKKQELRQKRPYFVAAFFAAIAGLLAHGYFYSEVAAMKRDILKDLRADLIPLQARAEELGRHEKKIASTKTEIDVYTRYLKNRYFWAEGLVEMRDLLLQAENKMPRPAGVWIETLGVVPTEELEDEGLNSFERTPQTPSVPWANMTPEMIKRYFPAIYEMLLKTGQLKQLTEKRTPPPANTNLVTINVKFRAINLSDAANPAANSKLAYTVADQFKASSLFDADATKLNAHLEQPDPEDPNFGTFAFEMTLKLKNDLQM